MRCCTVCALCGAAHQRFVVDLRRPSPGHSTLPDARQLGSSRLSAGAVRVVQCSQCGLAWQDPVPDAEMLEQMYP